MVGSEAVQPAGAHQVGAAVADMADPGVGSVSPLLHHGQHHCGSHALMWRARRLGSRKDFLIGARRRCSNGVAHRELARQRRKIRVKMLHRHPGCDGPSTVSADTAGHDEQVAHGDADMEDRILILFAQGAAVAFLGKKDRWLPGAWSFAHSLTSHKGQNLRFTVKRKTMKKTMQASCGKPCHQLNGKV